MSVPKDLQPGSTDDVATSETMATPAPLGAVGLASSPTATPEGLRLEGERPAGSAATIVGHAAAPDRRAPAFIDSATLRAPSTGEVGATPAPVIDASASRREELIGKTLAERYTVLDKLGAGGMSVVYLARHELLKKLVAIKLLRDEIAANKASLSRFHREALAAASIGDPHIVDVTDYGFTDRGEAFIVMERLEGQDLRRLIASHGALGVGRSVSIARQILRGLMAAHGRGIIHRDLKAENVFLCQRDGVDFVKLLDFGISKVVHPVDEGGPVAATGTGVVMGTPQYIAPEQAHGSPDVDHRADLYGLGVILYEMLTGSLPFNGSTPLEVVMKHVQEPPEPPRQRRPDLNLPEAVERVVLKALSKQPGDRFRNAEEMLAALPDPGQLPGGFVSGVVSGPLPAAPAPRRWPLLLAGAGVATAAGVVLLLLRGPQAPPTPPPPGLVPPFPAARPSAVEDARPDAARPDAARSDAAPRADAPAQAQPAVKKKVPAKRPPAKKASKNPTPELRPSPYLKKP